MDSGNNNFIKKTNEGFKIQLEVSVFYDEDSEKYIASCEHLQMYDFGDTPEGAIEMLKNQIKYDLVYMDDEGTLEQFLISLGWKFKMETIKPKSNRLGYFIDSFASNLLQRNPAKYTNHQLVI